MKTFALLLLCASTAWAQRAVLKVDTVWWNHLNRVHTPEVVIDSSRISHKFRGIDPIKGRQHAGDKVSIPWMPIDSLDACWDRYQNWREARGEKGLPKFSEFEKWYNRGQK
jgi:hypothetical protein